MLKDHGVDPQGGLAYSRYERVRVERVLTEAISKEDTMRETSRLQTGPPRFTMNCSNAQQLGSLQALKHSHSRLQVIADKVDKASPEERSSLTAFDPNTYEVKQMKHAEKIPAQKVDLPCTRAQEIGWLLSAPASHSYIQHRRRKNGLGGSDHVAERGGAQVSPPSARMQHSSSAPSLSPEPYLPLGLPLRDLNTLNNRRFYKPKTFCPITKYADTYVSLMHHDPFHQSATR